MWLHCSWLGLYIWCLETFHLTVRFLYSQVEAPEPVERPQAPSPHSPQLIELSANESDSSVPNEEVSILGLSEDSESPSQPSSRASTPEVPSRRLQPPAGDTLRMEINLSASHNSNTDSDMDSASDDGSNPGQGSSSRVNSPNMETENAEAGVLEAAVPSVSHDESMMHFQSPKKVKVPTPLKPGTSSVDDDEGTVSS